jgi:Desulfoferrodoxin
MENKRARFYLCQHCKNLVGAIHNSGVPMVCCGEPMTELVPNTSEGAQEKHLPVVSVSGDTATVKVGEAEHPMADNHSIQWIYLETRGGGQRKAFLPGDKPEATFALVDDEAVSAYAFCNQHGLWKTTLV